jgi:peptidoglycan/LPS O-acetylase OafA/YrhL
MTAVMVLLRHAAYGTTISLGTALTSHYQHLWFLQSLLIIFVLIAFCDSYARLSSKGLAVVALTTLAVSQALPFPNTLSVNGVVYLAPLFLFGILLREEPVLLGQRQIRVGVWFVAVGLLLQQAAPILGAPDVPRTSLAAALCGCGAAYVLFATCPRIALFEKVGAYSYTIYLWHSVAGAGARESLKHLVILPTGAAFILLLAIGVIVPIGIHLSVRRVPVLATLMAGLRSPSLSGAVSSHSAPARGEVPVARSANDNPVAAGPTRSGRVRTR